MDTPLKKRQKPFTRGAVISLKNPGATCFGSAAICGSEALAVGAAIAISGVGGGGGNDCRRWGVSSNLDIISSTLDIVPFNISS